MVTRSYATNEVEIDSTKAKLLQTHALKFFNVFTNVNVCDIVILIFETYHVLMKRLILFQLNTKNAYNNFKFSNCVYYLT